MSKNIKGKNLDINLNITQAGTFNADIFNAYQDFTLNGVSIVNRIATNEGDIALLNSEVITLQGEIDTNETDIANNTSDILDLQADKQDTLTFDNTPTAGSTNPVTSQGIKNYVDGSTPSITATAPINYNAGVISGTFDSVPTNGSVNFLSSDKVYDALQLKQDEITSSTSLTTANITANGNIIGLGSLAGASVLVSGDIRTSSGNITATAGTITAPTIIQGTTNLLNEINTKQDILTFDTTPTAGSTNPVTSQGIKSYVDNSTPTITANLPLDYSSATGIIRGIFDSVPTNSSINFLNSNVIYDALQLKQDEITSSTNLTTGNITANGNITASGGLSGASALVSGLVSGANLEATGTITGTTLQVNNSAGNQINCLGTGNSIFSDVLCGDITSSGSISTTTGQIGTTSGSISTSSGDIITSTGDITAPSGTISAGTISATGASGTITAPIIIQGTTNLLNEINTKQDLITSTTSLTTADITANGNITASSLSTTGSLLMTGGSSQISNAGAYNGTGNIVTSGNIIGTDFITNSGTNLLTKINTKQDLITASTALTCGSISTTTITNNPVINSGAINCNANITTASNITCGGDLTAIGTGNNIDLRNNLVAGGGISLSQTGNNTTINNTATGTSQLYYFRATSNNGGNQAITSATTLDYNVITYDVPSGNYNTSLKRYVVPIAGTYQFFFQAYQNSSVSTGFRLGIYKNGTKQVQTGGSVANSERAGVILECAIGDYIDVKGAAGNANVFMDYEYSWFEGYLLAGSSQLSTSQQYYFRATSNLNNNQLLASGSVLANFNQIIYDVPSGNYSTSAGAVKYVVPVAGVWQFFYQTFQNSPSTGAFRLGIFKNGILEAMTGALVSNTERCGVILECAVGDGIDVRWVSGSGYVYMSANHSWFEGYLLQPENNTITDTTDLTTNSITTLTGNIISGGDIETSSGNFLVTNSGDVECGDLQAENLIINTNLNNETFIRTIAIAKIESNGANSKAINCSVNRTNTGRYTFTFTSPRPTADYVINITLAENSVILDDVIVQVVNGTQTANGFNYFIHEQDNGGTAGVYRDRGSFISIFDTD